MERICEASDLEVYSHPDWELITTMCEFLAFSFRYPTTELAEACDSGEWLAAAQEFDSAFGFGLDFAYSGTYRFPDSAVSETLFGLRREATRLFVGSPDSLVSPYEGIWRERDRGVEGLLFVNPFSLQVERFARACGLGKPASTNEPLDHIATELELLEYLAINAGGLASNDMEGLARVEYPGGDAAAAFWLFARDHFLVWSSRFASSCSKLSRIPYYREAGKLLEAFSGSLESTLSH